MEQVFADVTDGPLAHLPSGSFAANAAWLTCAAIACNLLRAAGALASLAYARARGATLRRDLINVAARTARSGRGHITLHLPEGWHREHQWLTLFGRLRAARRRRPDQPGPGHRTAYGPQRPPEPRPRARNPGQAAEQVSGGKPTPYSLPRSNQPAADSVQPPSKPGRWIEAKSHAGHAIRQRVAQADPLPHASGKRRGRPMGAGAGAECAPGRHSGYAS